MPISTLLVIFLLPGNRKLADSTRPFAGLRVDCEKPTTQHETFLRVFVNVKKYHGKLSSVLSHASNRIKNDEHRRDSPFCGRRLICRKTQWFRRMNSFSRLEGSIYDRDIGCNFTLLLTTNFTRLFSSLFFYVSRKLRR